MSAESNDPPSYEELQSVLDHVFLPPKLPQADDHKLSQDILLSRLVYDSARDFGASLSQQQQAGWSIVIKMVGLLAKMAQNLDTAALVNDIMGLRIGGAPFKFSFVLKIASFHREYSWMSMLL